MSDNFPGPAETSGVLARDDGGLQRECGSREATINAVGTACYILSGLFALWDFGFLATIGAFSLRGVKNPPGYEAPMIMGLIPVIGGVYLAMLAWLTFRPGQGMRRRSPVARWGGVGLLTFSLAQGPIALVMAWREDGPLAGLGVSLCLLMPASILFLLLMPSTGVVFRRGDREAMTATPEMRPQLRLRSKLACASLLALFAAGVALAVVAARSSGRP